MANPIYPQSPLVIGTPQTIYRVLGNGLIVFVGADGNLYLMDVQGNINLLSAAAAIGGTIVANVYYTATGGEHNIPVVPDPKLENATYTMTFMEGTLLTPGTLPDEYVDTPQNGFVTLNFAAPATNRFRIIGIK